MDKQMLYKHRNSSDILSKYPCLIQHDMQVTPLPQRPQPVLVKLVPAKNRSEGEFSKR